MNVRIAQYALAAVLVRLADEGARVALALLALQRSGSAAVGGWLVAALLVPHVVAAPVVGLLTDRARRPRLVICAGTAVFGTALAAAAAGTGHLPTPAVVAVLLVGGCGGPALTGGLSSQLPALVSPAALPRAFGLDSLTYNGSGILGPAAAAVTSGLAGPAVATYALAGSALTGAAAIAVLSTRDAPTRSSATRAPRPSPLAGMRVMLADRTLFAVTAATSLSQLGAGALPVVAAVLAHHRHHTAAAGWLMTSLAAGGLLGSLAWSWRPASPARATTVVLGGLIASALPLAAAAGCSALPVTAILFAVSGLLGGPAIGALLTVRDRHAPAGLRGQVFTLGAGAKITAAAGGAALAGTLANLPDPAQLLAVAGFPLLGGALGATLLSLPARPAPRGRQACRCTVDSVS
ncbi:MAG: hypothetical protein V7603_351 [Micromonosporaceae bacterium]